MASDLDREFPEKLIPPEKYKEIIKRAAPNIPADLMEALLSEEEIEWLLQDTLPSTPEKLQDGQPLTKAE